MYHHTKSVLCYFSCKKTRGRFVCKQSSGRSINHPIKQQRFSFLAHGSCRSSYLTIFLMAMACHIALTNSVYLQAHQATLYTHCQLVEFWTELPLFLKYQQLLIPNIKDSQATLAHVDLEQDLSTERLLVPKRKCQIWVSSD